MNRLLYVGQYSAGTTSRMRADILQNILGIPMQVIDTHQPFYEANRVYRSMGFRFKMGPLIKKINDFVLSQLNGPYDIIWVDKAIFLNTNTIKHLKAKASRLIHFTPDMAFFANSSKLFNQSIASYDYIITTKSAEVDFYKKYVSEHKIILVSQGFDPSIHKPYYEFNQKDDSIGFIGLAEPYRFNIAESLIENGFCLKLCGYGWKGFVKKHSSNSNLHFIGNSIYNDEYSKLISSCKFGLGLLSKRFPELHTTRTFEIPACGTALLTEKNKEIESFFNNDEVIFFSDEIEILEKINYYTSNPEELKLLTKKGTDKVNENGYDYHSILSSALKHII